MRAHREAETRVQSARDEIRRRGAEAELAHVCRARAPFDLEHEAAPDALATALGDDGHREKLTAEVERQSPRRARPEHREADGLSRCLLGEDRLHGRIGEPVREHAAVVAVAAEHLPREPAHEADVRRLGVA